MEPERRFSRGSVRSTGPKGAKIAGHAAIFNSWTTIHEGRSFTVRERIIPGAFTRALKERQDVRALLNHDPSLILGRTVSGTCRLSIDSRGLAYEIDIPDTTVGRDARAMIGRGDISGSSFAFTVAPGGDRLIEEERDGKVLVSRELLDLNLHDVSPVTYPAYEGTDVSLRSHGLAGVEEILSRSGLLHPNPMMRARARRMADVSRRMAEGEALAARNRLASAKARLDEFDARMGRPKRSICPELSRNWY